MQNKTYQKPQIKTYEGKDIVDALGTASAASAKVESGGGFKPSTAGCGSAFGYPCP